MAPRLIGACLGLLAFSVTILFGLWVRNPVLVTLERSLWAMVVLCAVGFAVGAAVNVVVREHMKKKEAVLFSDEDAAGASAESQEAPGAPSIGTDAGPMDT